jgi:hypothetical protein
MSRRFSLQLWSFGESGVVHMGSCHRCALDSNEIASLAHEGAVRVVDDELMASVVEREGG